MNTKIIGAGPAGLTAAYQLSKHTPKVAVFEAADRVGGLSRSFDLWGQTVDLGPHRFFSQDKRVNELWLEVVGHDYAMVNRQTRILYKKKLFQYPLESFDALAKLGPVEALRCLTSYAKELVAKTEPDGSFENWVCQRFGRRLFEIFFKAYSEKLWGLSCKDLDADFAAQRIKNFSLAAAIKRALLPGQKKGPRTLVDQFAYPCKGTGMVYERMAEAVRQRGGEVHLGTPVRKVLTEGKRVVGIELFSGEQQPCDQVISSMPLTAMVRQLEGVPPAVRAACQQLRFRNTILIYLEVLNHNPFTDNWIYVHSPDLAFGRVTNFSNWVPGICHGSPHTILALEYWCNSDDEFWRRADEKLMAQAKDEIVRSGLVGHLGRIGNSFIQRVPKSYPVYRKGYNEHVKIIQEYLETIAGLQVIGRYGAFKYNNQDHSILMGRMAAENILQAEAHDLWGVNSDYETYQESCSITESGLLVETR